jgi:hypothetical protein
MPDDRPSNHSGQKTNTDEATIAAEEALQDAETAREARQEAEELEAIPFERMKKEHEDESSGSA